jgi:multiple sugar transport system substrate-binding protein
VSAAHEKLLTAVVGEAPPDVALLGNTWIPEFAAIHALEPLDSALARSPDVPKADYFSGIWQTNVVNDTLYGIPGYIDTRLLFYRTDLAAAAGFPAPPRTWTAWRAEMRGVRTRSRDSTFGVFLPTDEWQTLVALALANDAPLLRDGNRYADFEEPAFKTAFLYYIGLYRDSLAPAISDVQIANRYQSFARGEFAFTVTGPWDIAEYKHRLPSSLTGRWLTAPMPAPDGAAYPGAALAGGGSFAIFHGSRATAPAWALIEFLSQPAQQVRFAKATGDLPPRISTWRDPVLDTNTYVRAFREQLDNMRALPMIPEWEEIASTIADHAAAAARGVVSPDAALAALDHDVDVLLEKRRWLLDKSRTPQ